MGGLAAGAAASSIGSAILGNRGHHSGYPKHSNPIPIGGLAAGAGAAALGAAVLTGHHPVMHMHSLLFSYLKFSLFSLKKRKNFSNTKALNINGINRNSVNGSTRAGALAAVPAKKSDI